MRRLAILVLLLAGISLAQTVIKGNIKFAGVTLIGSSAQGPTTYSARFDQCELGSETGCTGKGLSYLGCNTWSATTNGTYTPGAAAWNSGTTYNLNATASSAGNVYLSKQAGNLNHSVSDTSWWQNLGACGTAPDIGNLTGANTTGANVITLPNFNTRVARVTDYATGSSPCGSGAFYHIGSNGAINIFFADSKKFLVTASGGADCIFAFSNDSTMTVTPSGIAMGGTCTGNVNCTHFIPGSSIAPFNNDPNSFFELDESTTNITLYKDTINNPTAAPSAWTFNRTKLFDWMTDCSGPCGLPSNFQPNWVGTMQASDDDTSITIQVGDDGQDGPPKDNTGAQQKSCPLTTTPVYASGGRYGASFSLNWTSGKGWRTYTMCGYPGLNGGSPYITGSWGDSGTPTSGAGQPLGTSGGSTLSDAFFVHEGGSVPDSHYANITASINNTGPGSCGGFPCSSVNTWEIGTTNVRPCTLAHCLGHNSKGTLYHYDSGKAYAHSYHDQSSPDTPLLANFLPADQHGTYNNVGPNDYQPPFFDVSQVCDVNGTAGGTPQPPAASGPCIPSYLVPYYNEIVAAENVAANPTFKHCDYGGGPNSAACIYRFGQSYNTGTNHEFQIQNSISNIDNSGRWMLFTSDWNLTLGCTNGWTGSGAQKCLDPVTASNSAVWGASTDAANWVSVDSSTPNQVTVTFASLPADNSLWSVGMYVKMSNFSAASFLNTANQYTNNIASLFIISVGTNCHGGGSFCFTGTGLANGHAGYSAAESAGKATWGGCTANFTSMACQRGDVFIMDLLSARP